MRDYQRALDRLRQTFGFDFVALSLVPAGRHPVLTWQYASGNLNSRYQRIILASGLGILGLVFKTGKPLFYPDVNRAISREDLVSYPIIIGEGLASLCAVPLWGEGALSAIMLAAFRYVGGMTDELLSELLATLAHGFEGLTAECETITVQTDDHRPIYDLMTHKILEAQEAERKRISRELHDGVVQELLGVQMLLRQTRYLGDGDQKNELIANAANRTNHILDEVRRIAVEQRPSTLDTLGLEATLSEYTKRQSATFGVDISFDGNVGVNRYEPTVETVVYRICQEAVVNACKYSGAESIKVTFSEVDGNLVLSVRDQGCGFCYESTVAERGGLGLSGMSERAELVEGKLEVHTKPGSGTTIELTVPCKRQQLTEARGDDQ
ncbi:MAG: GAF domain-containing sensor histidine kinase [Coriobacteriales bacterium]|jgi:two-component system sensor histidine kinase NreB|nr:GAF domain-containing sensor histidine kinase [Coriobacteriales bacterium]